MPSADSSSSARPPGAVLDESAARKVLLVQAFEEADREGLLLAPSERARATDRAREDAPAGEATDFLVHRAQALIQTLQQRAALVPALLRRTGLNPNFALVVVPALLVGLLSNAVGAEGRINVLAFPLLGIIVWNLAVYALLAFAACRGAKPRAAHAPAHGLVDRVADAYLHSAWTRALRGRGEESVVSANAASRFLATWKHTATPLLASRVRRVLHLGALALAIGAVGGMYLRGIAFEYRATFESTFLSADTATNFLNVVLWPATTLLGKPLPDLDAIRPPQSGEAALWIHFYAVTAALFVILPRTWLALRESARARSLARALPVDVTQAYFRRLLAPGRGARIHVEVLPYSYRPEQRSADNLKALLHDVFGARADVKVLERLEYGDLANELPFAAKQAAEADDGRFCCVTLYALAQSPEVEVQGRFLEELVKRLGERGCTVVLVDGATYRERMTDVPGGDERLEERRRAWDRVLREAGVAPVHVELDRLPPDELLTNVARSVFPADALSGVA